MLLESSNLTPPEVLAALKRHPGSAPLFKRDAPPPDTRLLLQAFKDVLLASHAARRFMDEHGIFWRWRGLLNPAPPEDIDLWVNDMVRVIKSFAQAVNRAKRGGLSPDARKELADWVNGDRRAFSLPTRVMRELAATPGIRPDRPVMLYRGLLFRRHQFDDEQHPRSALRFLAAARSGKRGLDMDWDRASSWTTDPATAERFARYGAQTSSFGAMFQALDRAAKRRAIDGEMGIVIATLARPQDILVDIGKVDLGHQQHGDEGEMILAPGPRAVRIVRMWNQVGEIDLKAPAADPSAQLVAALKGLHLDTTPAPMIGGDHATLSALLDPKQVALAYKQGEDVKRRYDLVRERLLTVLDGVDARALDPAQTALKALAGSDLRPTAEEIGKNTRLGSALRGLLDSADANHHLAAALQSRTSKAYHRLTAANQEALFGNLFARLLKAAGKERPETWDETVKVVRGVLAKTARLHAVAFRLNDILYHLREVTSTVTEQELAEAKKAFLDEDAVVSYEPSFPLKYVPGMEDRAEWFLSKFERAFADPEPAYCDDMRRKLLGHDDRPVLLYVDPAGECRAVLDGNHRIGAALARGATTIPAFVGRGHALDEKAPPGVKAERFIRKAKKDFKKRYGKDWEARLYGTAWKLFGEGVKDA